MPSALWGRLRCSGAKEKVNRRIIDLVDVDVRIGRHDKCQIHYATDGTLSGVHARLFMSGGKHWLEDLSTNGTYVNNELIGKGKRRLLKHDDVISLVERALGGRADSGLPAPYLYTVDLLVGVATLDCARCSNGDSDDEDTGEQPVSSCTSNDEGSESSSLQSGPSEQYSDVSESSAVSFRRSQHHARDQHARSQARRPPGTSTDYHEEDTLDDRADQRCKRASNQDRCVAATRPHPPLPSSAQSSISDYYVPHTRKCAHQAPATGHTPCTVSQACAPATSQQLIEQAMALAVGKAALTGRDLSRPGLAAGSETASARDAVSVWNSRPDLAETQEVAAAVGSAIVGSGVMSGQHGYPVGRMADSTSVRPSANGNTEVHFSLHPEQRTSAQTSEISIDAVTAPACVSDLVSAAGGKPQMVSVEAMQRAVLVAVEMEQERGQR